MKKTSPQSFPKFPPLKWPFPWVLISPPHLPTPHRLLLCLLKKMVQPRSAGLRIEVEAVCLVAGWLEPEKGERKRERGEGDEFLSLHSPIYPLTHITHSLHNAFSGSRLGTRGNRGSACTSSSCYLWEKSLHLCFFCFLSLVTTCTL